MDEQPFLPGFHPPCGWTYEQKKSCIDMQSSSRSDGYVEWWSEEFSRNRPASVPTVRNVKPVFDRTL